MGLSRGDVLAIVVGSVVGGLLLIGILVLWLFSIQRRVYYRGSGSIESGSRDSSRRRRRYTRREKTTTVIEWIARPAPARRHHRRETVVVEERVNRPGRRPPVVVSLLASIRRTDSNDVT